MWQYTIVHGLTWKNQILELAVVLNQMQKSDSKQTLIDKCLGWSGRTGKQQGSQRPDGGSCWLHFMEQQQLSERIAEGGCFQCLMSLPGNPVSSSGYSTHTRPFLWNWSKCSELLWTQFGLSFPNAFVTQFILPLQSESWHVTKQNYFPVKPLSRFHETWLGPVCDVVVFLAALLCFIGLIGLWVGLLRA